MTSTFTYDSNLSYDTNQKYNPYNPSAAVTTTTTLPHLSGTLALGGDGSFQFNLQDTIDDVAQCVEVIVGTPVGQRTMVPTFGVPDPTFARPNISVISAAIQQFEPRAIASVQFNDSNPSTEYITVNVALQNGSTV